MMKSFTKKYSLGVDVSDTGVKMLLLTKDGKRIAVAAHGEALFPKEAHCDGRMVDEQSCAGVFERVYGTMRRAIPRQHVPTIASLSDAHTQIALITLPADLVNEARVLEEAAKHIPIHPETTIMDWQRITEENGTATIFVITAPRRVSDALTTALETARCFPHAIESESVALARLFGGEKPTCIVDLGERRALLVICRFDVPLFTVSLPLTGAALTETIAKTLKLSLEDAEGTKIRCGFDDTACTGALREVVREHLTGTVQKIRVGLDAIATNSIAAPSAIILVGGGAHLKKIDAVLAQELGIPVTQGNLWARVEQPKNFPETALAWAVPLGLALREL